MYLADEGATYTPSGDPGLDVAIRIDEAVKQVRSDDWRGIDTRENTIKKAIYDVLGDEDGVERLFLIVKAQKEY